MYRHALILAALCSFFVSTAPTQAKSNDNAATSVPTITITKLDVGHKTLRLAYEIRNEAGDDVWICDSISHASSCEVYLDDDGKTLVIRKRLDVPSSVQWGARPIGKYVRLGSGKKRDESLLLAVPVNSDRFYSRPGKDIRGIVSATRLAIEIGYYVGNLPQTFLATSEGRDKSTAGESTVQNVRLGAAVVFNDLNESLIDRDEEVRIPYTHQRFEGEQILVAAISDLSIPYKETVTQARHTPPDLTTCTRVEIRYEPSLLEYFYPYENQRRLLNKEEIESLQSQKSVVIESPRVISDLANELKQARQTVGGIVSRQSKADVVGYDDSERATSFVVYNDTSVDTEQEKRIRHLSELQSLRTSTPQIQPFELRMRCAINMKNLWYRLRFYDRAEKSRVQSLSNFKLDDPNRLGARKKTRDMELDFEKLKEDIVREAESFSKSREEGMKDLYSNIDLVYPVPRRWCDALEWAWAGSAKGEWHDSKMKAHVCPGVSAGRSTYALNALCKYDSPPDTVLLFETKTGWNQHGGPELFTFDNHDPKGGCVLLNDGTAKFIRTAEELQQLRWK